MNNTIHYLQQYFRATPAWYQWANRENIEGSERVGAYVLGVFEGATAPREGILSEKVVYVGVAQGRTRSLRLRWRDFDRTAQGRADNHSGASTFREKNFDLKKVWLVAFPVSDGVTQAEAGCLAQLFEREILWHYCKKNKRLPACNKK